MNIRHAFPSPRESAEDLLLLFPTGTVVTIDRCEPRKNNDEEEYWQIYFDELEKPISLNKTNAFAIANITQSDEMDDWRGTQVKLMPVPVEVPAKVGGGKEYVTGFRIFPVKHGETPTLRPKSSLQRLIEQKRRASLTPGPGAAPAAADAAPIGVEKAAMVVVELERRNKDLAFLVNHIRGMGMGHLVEGRMPDTFPSVVLQITRKLLGSFPKVKDVPDSRVKELVDIYTAPPANDVVDKTTGEVIRPGVDSKDPYDDIPF